MIESHFLLFNAEMMTVLFIQEYSKVKVISLSSISSIIPPKLFLTQIDELNS